MSCKSVVFYWGFWKPFRDIFSTHFSSTHLFTFFTHTFVHISHAHIFTHCGHFSHTHLLILFSHTYFEHFFHACILDIFFTHCIRPSTLSSIHPLGRVERRESGGRGWILCEKRRLHSLPPLRRGPSRAQLGTLWESRTSRCHCDQWLELNNFVRLEKERNEKKQHFPNTFFHALFTLLRCRPDACSRKSDCNLRQGARHLTGTYEADFLHFLGGFFGSIWAHKGPYGPIWARPGPLKSGKSSKKMHLFLSNTFF